MSDSTPIGKDIVATFHYTLSDEAGQKLESTEGEDPVTYPWPWQHSADTGNLVGEAKAG